MMWKPFLFAEDEGFKPPIPRKGYTGFRVQRIRSLCQSSLLYVCINNVYQASCLMIECKSNTLFCNKQRISRFIFPIFCISCRLF